MKSWRPQDRGSGPGENLVPPPELSAPGTAGTSVHTGPASHTLIGSLPLAYPIQETEETAVRGSEPKAARETSSVYRTKKELATPLPAGSQEAPRWNQNSSLSALGFKPKFKNTSPDQVQDNCPAIPWILAGTEPDQDPRITMATISSKSSTLSLFKRFFHFKIELRAGEEKE